MAKTANGVLAALAVTWYDDVNRTGLLEAVGTHPDHQQRGLGRAVASYVLATWPPPGWSSPSPPTLPRSRIRGAYRSAGF